MAKIEFESFESTSEIVNPLKGFTTHAQQIEVRRDPLLGDTSVYNPELKDKAKTFYGDCDSGLIEDLVRESAKNCLFCGEGIEKKTPLYPSELITEGRLKIGEATLFPNLFPIGKYHAIISLSKAHFLKLSEFSPGLVESALQVAQRFVNTVFASDPSALFVALNANYLFPAGSSLVHPHLQLLVTPIAYSYHGRINEAGNAYYHEKGSCYYSDLIAEEKQRGVRHIAQRGRWHWLTAFAPMGSNEVVAIHEGESDFGLLSKADLGDLSFGISRVLSFYETLGHLSFNYTLFSVRKPLSRESFRCNLKIINRQNPYPNYRNDDYYLQKMLHSDVILNLPEELAPRLREFFSIAR